jgi:hypothetical protein
MNIIMASDLQQSSTTTTNTTTDNSTQRLQLPIFQTVTQLRPVRPLPSPGRPVSMPPSPNNIQSTSDDRERGAVPDDTPVIPKRREGSSKTRTSHKNVGDYTLGKTLGQGSMGKVKLAVHNQTGEKVQSSLTLPFSSSLTFTFTFTFTFNSLL